MKKSKISLEDLERSLDSRDYARLYQFVVEQIDAGKLIAIKSAGVNGKTPALCNRYWKIDETEDYQEYFEEMQYHLSTEMDLSYFMKHPEKYAGQREAIRSLSEFLIRHSQVAEAAVNERSFEIFHREKFLTQEGGRTLLRKLGIDEKRLNFYETREPLAYYTRSRTSGQNILIIENKDTFYSMRKALDQGKRTLLGMQFETLIYGAGKAVYRSFADVMEGVETYFKDPANRLWYFGDLDYEGIGIYETLAQMYPVEISLFTNAYERMLKKAEDEQLPLPETKEKQNRKIGTLFLDAFEENTKEKIIRLLESGTYIPQEIINAVDF